MFKSNYPVYVHRLWCPGDEWIDVHLESIALKCDVTSPFIGAISEMPIYQRAWFCMQSLMLGMTRPHLWEGHHIGFYTYNPEVDFEDPKRNWHEWKSKCDFTPARAICQRKAFWLPCELRITPSFDHEGVLEIIVGGAAVWRIPIERLHLAQVYPEVRDWADIPDATEDDDYDWTEEDEKEDQKWTQIAATQIE